MKKLITFISFLFLFTCVHAEEVKYSLEENGKEMGQVTFNYNENGYTATVNGEPMSFEQNEKMTTVSFGKQFYFMPIPGPYYTKKMGELNGVPFFLGDKTKADITGWHTMLYVTNTPEGRLYLEQFFSKDIVTIITTVVDDKDQIVWFVLSSKQGTLRFLRKQ